MFILLFLQQGNKITWLRERENWSWPLPNFFPLSCGRIISSHNAFGQPADICHDSAVVLFHPILSLMPIVVQLYQSIMINCVFYTIKERNIFKNETLNNVFFVCIHSILCSFYLHSRQDKDIENKYHFAAISLFNIEVITARVWHCKSSWTLRKVCQRKWRRVEESTSGCLQTWINNSLVILNETADL